MKGLNRIKEVLKALKKIEKDVKEVLFKKVRGSINITIVFCNKRNAWKIARVSKKELKRFVSFLNKRATQLKHQ